MLFDKKGQMVKKNQKDNKNKLKNKRYQNSKIIAIYVGKKNGGKNICIW